MEGGEKVHEKEVMVRLWEGANKQVDKVNRGIM